MTTRADKFLEGFKLGSLGVGSKKPILMVGHNDQELKSLTILSTNIGRNLIDLFRIVWRDTDGYTYSLATFTRINWEQFALSLRGKKTLLNDSKPMGNYEWSVFLKSVGFDKQDKKRMFEEWVSLIKEHGIKALLEQYKLKTFRFGPVSGSFSDEFLDWLHEKEKA